MSAFRVTATPGKFEGLDLNETTLTTEELTEILVTGTPEQSAYDVRDDKDGGAIIPAIFRTCPEKCRNAAKPKAKDCGGGVMHRLGANVKAMTMFGADIDDVTEADAIKLLTHLRDVMGLAFWYWQTFSHDPKGAEAGAAVCRFRVLIPFSEPMPLKSAKQWSKGAWPLLLKHLGLNGVVTEADHACSDPARVYYLPAKPSEEAERESAYFEGKELDWKAVLGDSLEGFDEAANIEVRPPQTDETRPVDLVAVREKLAAHARRGPVVLLQRLLAGNALTSPPAERKAGERPRYACWRAVTQSVANQLEEWMSTDVLLELFRASWDAEVKASPDDYTEWSIVEHLFETARSESAASKAEWEAKKQAEKTMMLRALREIRPNREPKLASVQSEEVEDDVEQIAETAVDDTEEDPNAWLSDASAFVWRSDKEGNQTMAKDKVNLERIVAHDPELQLVRLNELSLNVEVCGPVFDTGVSKALERTHATAVMHRIRKVYGIDFDTSLVWEYLVLAAYLRRYDPLKDFLNGLAWDGRPRLHRLFIDYIRCRVPDNGGEPYLETLAKRWLTGGVARGLTPGCKMDNILHLEGAQGVGKTTALDILGGKFYADTELNFEDKDAKMMCARYWLMELAEGVSLTRSSKELRKGFLSRRVDSFRAPYAAGLGDHPRRAFFASTTNEDDYLDDVTGHRRDWVVEVLSVDVMGLRRDREQLLAEAVHLFKTGFEWHMTESENVIAAEQAANRSRGDAVAEKIEAWILGTEPANRLHRFTTATIIERALGETVGRGMEGRVNSALKGQLGCTKDKHPVRDGGQRVRMWNLPERLVHAPKQGSMQQSLSDKIASAVKPAQA
jgi:hypothetical protein